MPLLDSVSTCTTSTSTSPPRPRGCAGSRIWPADGCASSRSGTPDPVSSSRRTTSRRRRVADQGLTLGNGGEPTDDVRATGRWTPAGRALAVRRRSRHGCPDEMRDAEIRLDERIESLRIKGRLQFTQHSSHQAEVHRADDVAVFLGRFAKGAVVQQDPALSTGRYRFRGEPDVVQRIDEPLYGPRCVQTAERRLLVGKESTPGLTGLQGGVLGLLGVGREVAGQNLGEQPVAAPAGLDRTRGGGVQRARSAWRIPILDRALSQTQLD